MVLSTSYYEPFGTGVAFQTFNPSNRIGDALRYTGTKILDNETPEYPAHAEALSLVNNLSNARAQFDVHRYIVKVPVIRNVDGVLTVVTENVFSGTAKVSRMCSTDERERLYWLGTRVSASTAFADMTRDNIVPF
jgi:hypothetical protein